jgi:4-amino-4-deoxy-L-arabinose transferase-like glycosyltransferase
MQSFGQSENQHYSKLAFAFVSLSALVWWVLFSAGRSSLDTYGDMAEAYSWGISWQLGYDKHPPLSAWISAAWFTLFPTRDWAYYLLAMVNQAVAFWFVFLAGKRWLTPPHALLAVMLTSLVPLFGPDTGFKFNANSAMLPWVAMFAWSLIAAVQTHAYRYLVIAGIAGGAACMVKYWAPLMLTAITLGVILIVFQSKSFSWRLSLGKLLAIAGLTMLLFVPHLTWAIRHHWPGLRYAHAAHPFTRGASSLESLWEMMLDFSLVALLPLAVWLISVLYVHLFANKDTKATRTIVESTPWVYVLQGISIFAFAVLLTAESAHLAGIEVATKWLIPAWLFFSWFLCTAIPKSLHVERMLWPTAVTISLYWVGLFVYVGQINPSFNMLRDANNQRHAVADEVTQVFRERFDQPLQFVAGDEALIFSTAFYSKDHPVAVADLDFVRTSWVDEAELRDAGVVVICETANDDCMDIANERLGQPQITKRWQGLADDGSTDSVTELFYAPRLPPKKDASASSSGKP